MIKTKEQSTEKAGVTVEQFADEIGVKPERLLDQFKDAGISFAGIKEVITEAQKQKLLRYLQEHHGAAKKTAQPERIVLRRAKTSEIKLGGGHGAGKTVSIQVRKKRTLVKKHTEEETPAVFDEPLITEAAAEVPVDVISDVSIPQSPDQLVDAAVTPVQEVVQAEVVTPAVADVKPAEEKAGHKHKPKHTLDDEAELEEKERQKKKKKVRDDSRNRDDSFENLLARGANLKRVLSQEEEDALEVARRKSGKSRARTKVNVQAFTRPTQPVVREVQIPETIILSELAQRMSVKAPEVIKIMIKMGVMATINQVIDQDTAILVVEEMGHVARPINQNAVEDALQESVSQTGEEKSIPPVITIMGHVDHGKTTLLDYIRTTKVAAGEAGGITQHIGAYHVETAKGTITFLDTPGHAAFTAMRARGAKLTDIVILVVAADDGVMPQTVEAIEHAKAAGVPIVVAVNKMDKHGVEPDKIKTEVTKYGLVPEEWGGDTMFVPISAKTGLGVDNLLDSILVQAEMLALKAVIDCPARGVVIESRLERGRGAVMSVLVQQGTLRKGDIILAGQEHGRIRALFDEKGTPVESAGPSIPVEVLGLSGIPQAGDDFIIVSDERKAREVASYRQTKARAIKLAHAAPKLEDLMQRIEQSKTITTLNLLVKADVIGSVEAIRQTLTDLSGDEVRINIISSGVGGINESDVNLAIASRAIIIAFNVRANAEARKLMEINQIDVHYYNIIYDVINEVKKAINGALQPEIRERVMGMAEVREVFRSSKTGTVAGCMVTEGLIKRNFPIRVLRDDVVVFEGQLESLRRFKDDASEVRAGMECGIAVKNYSDVKAGDKIEVFERTEVKREI